MKKLLIILLAAMTLTGFAQEKKTIAIQQPKGDNAMMANMVIGKLTTAFASSKEWQPVERPSEEEMNRRVLAGEPVGNIQPAQYILNTEIQEVFGEFMISCKIMDVETARIVNVATVMCKPTSQGIKQASSKLAKQLL